MTTSRIYAYRWPARLVSHKPFAAESYSITPSCIWQVFFRKKNEFSFLFSPFCQRAHFLCKMHNLSAFSVWKTLPRPLCRGSMDGFAADYTYYIRDFFSLNPLSHRCAMPAPPKGEPLAVHANFISLPRPLPLGEADANVVSRRRGRGCFPAARPFPKETSIGKLPLPSTTPPVKMAYRSVRRRSGMPKI